MNDNLQSIQKQVEALKSNIFNVWNLEGKWDLENPEAPYNGMEKDPIVNLLLTAVIYQSNLIKDEINSFNDNLVNDYLDILLPYNLVKPVPAMAMLETQLSKGKKSIVLDDTSRFVIKKKNSKSKATLSFYPVIKTKILNAKIVGINKASDNKWNVDINFNDANDSLAGMTLYFDNRNFSDLKVWWNDSEIPIVKPWEADNFPLNSMFSTNNYLYNSSMVYGIDNQWFDMLAENNLNLFMVPLSFDKPVGDNNVHLTFEFAGSNPGMELDTADLHINCFPIVNVILNNNNNCKPFVLSESKPIVCISNDVWSTEYNSADFEDKNPNEIPDFFMNLVMLDDNDFNDKDKFMLRRFGAERFNINELLILAKKLANRYQSDFFAFQNIDQLQNSSIMQKLDDILKEILEILNKQNAIGTGVYAILKHTKTNSVSGNAIKINALFTNGNFANTTDKDVTITPPSQLSMILDGKSTKLLTKISGGKDPITDIDIKQQITKYYVLTNDKIVTRSDIKAFVIKQLAIYGIKSNAVLDIKISNDVSDNSLIQNVEIVFDKSVKNHNIPMIVEAIARLANMRCASGICIKMSAII